MTRPVRILLRIAVALAAASAVLFLAAVIVARSPWFAEHVRARIILETQRATGGRVEVGAFAFDWRRLTATVSPFVLRGTEPATETPLFRADSIQVGLTVVSIFRYDIDVNALVIERPHIHVRADADGRLNSPSPASGSPQSRHWSGRFLDLAVARLDVRDGLLDYGNRRLPLDVRAENFRATFEYDRSGPRYRGRLESGRLSVGFGAGAVRFGLDASAHLEQERIAVPNARLVLKETAIDLSGAIENLRSSRAEFDVRARLALGEIGPPWNLPVAPQGVVSFTGKATLGGAQAYSLHGEANGSGLAWRRAGVRVENAGFRSGVDITPGRIDLPRLIVHAFGGRFTGVAHVVDFDRFVVEGQLAGMSTAAVSAVEGVPNLAWSGAMSGPVKVEGRLSRAGVRNSVVTARILVVPSKGQTPVEGTVDFHYDQAAQAVDLGQSSLVVGSSRINFTGAIGGTLRFWLLTRNLDELLPLATLANQQTPTTLPVELRGGAATIEGTITGRLPNPTISAHASITGFAWQGRLFDRVTTDVVIERTGITADGVKLERGAMQAEGQIKIGLSDWKPNDKSSISGAFRVRGARLGEVLKEIGAAVSADGDLTAAVSFAGTVAVPEVQVQVDVTGVMWNGEKADRLNAELRYKPGFLEVVSARLEKGPARVEVSGAFEPASSDWKSGRARFDVAASRLNLAEVRAAQDFHAGLNGDLTLKAQGAVEVSPGGFQLQRLDGEATVRDLATARGLLGTVRLDAKTLGDTFSLTGAADVRGAPVRVTSAWKFTAGHPGSGSVEFGPFNLSALEDLLSASEARPESPFRGVLSGKASFEGPLLQPLKWKAQAELTSIELRPRDAKSDEIVLRNDGPLRLEVHSGGVSVRQARLVGIGTRIDVAGVFSFLDKSPWDLKLLGSMNLAILKGFRAGVFVSGNAAVDATIRGAREDPQIYGRLTLQNASLFVEDFPNGIDQVSGVVLFDRNRATIADKLAGQTGGGALALTGFIGFGGSELIYTLGAEASGVRIRYPEAVSTTLNASLTLNGSSTRSLLAGQVTVLRSGFHPRTDIASLLAQTGRPVLASTTPNEFLRGMQFDVRVTTAPHTEFQSTLTREIQADADLRLRGSPLRPALLGRVRINQGEINFLGNRYTISRGEIGFFNPVRVEPVLDMDLETRARGVTVTINFSGTLDKLNVNYRSDPPLASPEIIALLTVGRSPEAGRTMAAGQAPRTGGFLEAGANTLLGQAIAAPVSSRLQQFFGVSRLKIDPQLTGLEGHPEAHLTIEQQVSKDITLTLVTNLTRSQQQIVRLEWALSKHRSLIAVRDENGIFGVDFQYRKRFK